MMHVTRVTPQEARLRYHDRGVLGNGFGDGDNWDYGVGTLGDIHGGGLGRGICERLPHYFAIGEIDDLY